ncbi:unnamed protein product [Leptidea sinapis]|uniref:Calsyntenin C-terminal domain-containing protein n=1 Tax=Leptidea sinapis TaxID=189913 RepID=A0A5E4PVP7_9NEOP|nr:unnamed protein product [Leptidea sinapis]
MERLEACSSDERCPGVTRIQAAITLQASRAGVACDRDTYTLHAQKTICGLDPKTIDLLPSPGVGNEWAKSLKPDSADVRVRRRVHIGRGAREHPASLHRQHVRRVHVAATRAAARPRQTSQGAQMNRHHYALFVRNCRLILLLRRDFGEGDLNIFRPAEWRWKLPELFVDGEPYRALDGKGPEVIDDWPLHPAQGINTTLVVGACWQGTESDMKHHMHGWMAGLGVLEGTVHSSAALRCAARCREGLSLAPDLYLKSVSVEGDGVSEVETLVRRVACDNGRVIKARPAESYVMVLSPQTPTIVLNGSADAARDYAHFRAGLPVFPDLEVRVLGNRDTEKVPENQKLDSCVVSVYPALNPDHEALSLRGHSTLPATDIQATLTRDGANLVGTDNVNNYQKKPAYYLNRVFKLTCSELNGRFTSNEYVQTLTVVHPRAVNDIHAQRPSGVADKMDVARDKLLRRRCPEPVVVLVALGVARARAAREHRESDTRKTVARHRVPHDAEMAWDDSALTITVNPMDESATDCGVVATHSAGGETTDGESCSDSDSDRQDSSDEEDEVITGKQHKYRNISQLEWDNSTM